MLSGADLRSLAAVFKRRRRLMHVLRSKRFLVIAAVAVAAGVTAAVAIPAVISQSVITDVSTVHFRVQKTIADGFDSGWHVHPGLAIVQVQQGSFQIYQGSCTPRTVSAGDTYIEVPWEPVRAVTTGRVVWTTSLLISGDQPVQIPQASYNPQQANPCP
jgi:hypothetical protein